MALLHFKYGEQSTLGQQSFAAGTVYITKDTKKLFVDNPSITGSGNINTDRICLGDFQLINWTQAQNTSAESALNSYPLKDTNILYITVGEDNATVMWRYTGTTFAQISNSKEINDIIDRITSLESAVSALNTFKDETAPATYMSKAGGTFTGDVSFKIGEYLTVNTPRTGDAGKKDVTTREYVDTAKSDLLGSSTGTTTASATIYDVKRAAAAAQSTADDAVTAADAANDNANARVSRNGDTMTGLLILSGDPEAPLGAATKQYVDNSSATTLKSAKDYTDARENAIMGTTESSADSVTVHGVKKKADANETAISDINEALENVNTALDGKAPTKHNSENTTYGVATNSLYGHVKLSDVVDFSGPQPTGTAASPVAVRTAYYKAVSAQTAAENAAKAAHMAKSAADTANTNADTRVSRSGDTMTGALTLFGDPVNDLEAATKQYVDTAEADAISTAANDATTKANAVLGTSEDGSTANTVYGAKAAAAAAQTAADNARSIAAAAMPKAGGTFTGNVTMGSGKTLIVNAPTAGNQAATAKYVDDAKAAAISAVQGSASDTKNSTTVVGAKKYTDDKISGVNSKIKSLEDSIDNVSNIMNFLGTTTSDIKQDSELKTIEINGQSVTVVAGDVVVKDAKEFVFDGTKWQEIGDVSAQSTAIDGLLSRMYTAEGDIDALEGRMGTAEGKIEALEKWKGTHATEYNNLEGRMGAAEGNIEALQNTVGTKPNSPTMETTLWGEVADLREDLGESTAEAGTTTAFARIKAAEGAIGAAGNEANAAGSLYARSNYANNSITAINSTIGTSHDATTAGTLYGRINANDASIEQLITVLTWGTF